MDYLNIYFETLDANTCSILKGIRVNLSHKTKLWFNTQACNTADDTIKRQIRNIRNYSKIDENISLDHSVQYYEWDGQQVIPLNSSLNFLIQRHLSHKTSFLIIGNQEKYKHLLLVFIDAFQRKDLPNSFLKFKHFNTWNELFDYFMKEGMFNFCLDNPQKFKRTSKTYQGAPIYEDLRKSTKGQLIYLDKLHKVYGEHYEVFDGTGNHLGEMTLNGTFDPTKRDPNKKLDDI